MLNLQGRTYMTPIDCPFRAADRLLAALNPAIKVKFVDFHAEVTSEKVAMGWYLDGRVSAVVGTHTHIPTADTRLLPGGTAYQTDVGMCGDYDSVIGMKKEGAVLRFIRKVPGERLAPADGEGTLCAALVETDDKTGLARSIRPVRIGGRLPSTD